MTRDALAETRGWLSDLEHRRAYGAEIIKLDWAMALAEARASGEISQRELAELMRVSQAYIAKLESGRANPTISRVGEILAAMFFRQRFSHEPLLPAPSPTPAASNQFEDQAIDIRSGRLVADTWNYEPPSRTPVAASSTSL